MNENTEKSNWQTPVRQIGDNTWVGEMVIDFHHHFQIIFLILIFIKFPHHFNSINDKYLMKQRNLADYRWERVK